MKAIALISGGLDSTLAAKLMQNLGIELVCMNTVSPFCLCNHRSSNGCLHGAGEVARELGLKLTSINVAQELLEIIKAPKHGYGSNMNPCIDCRILLFKKAKEEMQKQGASFVITGEVLGQRPMSQRLQAMELIEKEAGLEGLVLRPLSAKALAPSIPEQMDWVNRDALLAINGRCRKEQFSLAKQFNIKDYPCPSGGCLLTDPEFSKRLKDLMAHEGLSLDGVHLLKLGRHFRLSENARLVVGRNEKENQQILNLAKDSDYLFMPNEKIAGPTALGRGDFSPGLIELACMITCRYSDINGSADILYTKKAAVFDFKGFHVSPIDENELQSLRI